MATKSRRGRNEGSIRQRADGRWEARVCLGYEGGKLKRRSFYGATRQEVQRKMARAIVDLQKGLQPPSELLTVSAFLDQWLAECVHPPAVKPSTYTSYEGHVRLHIKPVIGRVRLSRLSPEQVQRMVREKIDQGLSPKTVRHIVTTLRTALNQALKWGLVGRNVACLVTVPRIPRTQVNPLTADEVRTLFEAVRGDRYEALYILVVATGLRKGEALGLMWSDIDLETGRLSVRRALQRVGGKLELVETKTATSIRTLALPDFATAALKRHKAVQSEERLLAGGDWQDSGLVFTSRVGTPMDPDNVTKNFKRALKRAGLRDQRFHDLRHCAATMMLSQGVPARVVMETLGHSQISLTMNTYSHVIPALQEDAAARMDALLGESRPS